MRLDAKAIAARNERIRDAARDGRSAAWIAQTFGVSIQTVYEATYGAGIDVELTGATDPTADQPQSEWEAALVERPLEHTPADPAWIAGLEDSEGTVWPDIDCVYFVQEATDPYVKIGITSTARLAKRLSALNSGNPRKLHLRRLIRGDWQTEIALHQHFALYHVRGEWFLADGELATVARTAC